MLRDRTDSALDRDDDRDDRDESDEPSRLVKAGTVCAVLLGAMLLASVAIIVWSRASSSSPTRSGQAGAAAAPVSAPATAAVPAAASSTRSAAAVSPTPGQVTWLQVGLGALPFSATSGPTAIHAGVPTGFAHTQPGAVMAAVQILGRLSWAAQTSTSMHAVAAACTTPAAQAVKALTYGPPTDPSLIPAVAGFQVVTYAPGQAVANLAIRFNGTLRVVPATLQWVGGDRGRGDWELAGAPGPLTDTNWAAVDDLTGYVLFSGQPTKDGN